MDTKVLDAVNEQIRNELYAAYLYLSMSAHFEDANFPGFAAWMRLQAQEELSHAMRLFDYLLRRGSHVELRAIDQPPSEFGSPAEVFQAALEHERHVTQSIHAIYKLAGEHADFATQQELQWFITEQVEEEDSAETAVEQLRMAGDDSAALLMLDREFGARQPEEDDGR
jgi:ferritin